MATINRIKHKDENGVVTEADIGALAGNIVTDETHRFVSDTDITSWGGKLAPTGDASNTTIETITESTDELPVFSTKEPLRGIFGKIKKWQQDCAAKFGNYVLKSMITNQQINSQNNIPSSALVYLMQQAIQSNTDAISKLNAGILKIDRTTAVTDILNGNYHFYDVAYLDTSARGRFSKLYAFGGADVAMNKVYFISPLRQLVFSYTSPNDLLCDLTSE